MGVLDVILWQKGHLSSANLWDPVEYKLLILDSCSSSISDRNEKRPASTSSLTVQTTTSIVTEENIVITTLVVETHHLLAYEHIQSCDKEHDENFCLNGGTCFIIKIHPDAELSEYNCECPHGFHGFRCDYKSTEANYESRPKTRIYTHT